jgi:cobalt/nickel transport system permease protein
VPLLGVVSALVLVSMSSEIVPIAYHINLSVLAGVLLGPWLGAISAFIVVLVLALLGHGGVTVVGLNALVIAAEMALGWALVRSGLRLFGRRRTSAVAGAATVVTLALSTAMLVGIVALSGAGATTRETGALDPETLEFRNPLSGAPLSIGLLGAEGHSADDEQGGYQGQDQEATGDLDVRRFAVVVFTLGPPGWIIEALITAGILGYVARVRPSLLFAGGATDEYHPRYGDEHGRH